MTREEAIEKLEAFAPMVVDDTREALDMAIETLQAEPVCEHFYKGYCSRFEDGCFRQCQAEPKTGEWITNKMGMFECTVCKQHEHIKHKFCPNCGAKMDKEVNNE